MFHRLFRKWKKKNIRNGKGMVNPDEIFLDSSNLPLFDRDQFEGRIETPIAMPYLSVLKYFFLLIAIIFVGRAVQLQVISGSTYFAKASSNNLKKEVIFANRGIIEDRNGTPLAWNAEGSTTDRFDRRIYTDLGGFANILGFVKYPGQDKSGNFYSFSIVGQDGVEKHYDSLLTGKNGAKLTEVSVKGQVESQSTLEPPQNGEKLVLSIDAKVQRQLYLSIKDTVERSGFRGGAGIIMDVHTGEVLASVSYPTYDSNIMTDGEKSEVAEFLLGKNQPFLDRVSNGLYAPGSIVKPFVAIAALEEDIINPRKEIHTIGYLSLPNPYDPSKPSIFKDWKNHGSVDMRRAIAVSSDVYFYIIGGGLGDQKGLGIRKIDEYLTRYLFGVPVTGFFGGPDGVIPTPEWKEKTFNGDPWRIGNTYHTSIGQYGFQVTPAQMARAITGIATEGTLVEPTIIKGEQGKKTPVGGKATSEEYKIVKEGMRMAVTGETAIALNIDGVEVAAKTGTAEIGASKDRINSWVEGFFPYDNPRYAFALVLESGPTTYAVSSMRTMADTLTWVRDNTPEHVK
ncbi:MAG: penicillin-binding transpeptidase domain-containing protein [Candidatus Paceibacterota bacterium]|jgi:penicillin-binding protein 2